MFTLVSVNKQQRGHVHPLLAISAAVASRSTKSLRFQFLINEPSFVPHPTSMAVDHAAAIVDGACRGDRVGGLYAVQDGRWPETSARGSPRCPAHSVQREHVLLSTPMRRHTKQRAPPPNPRVEHAVSEQRTPSAHGSVALPHEVQKAGTLPVVDIALDPHGGNCASPRRAYQRASTHVHLGPMQMHYC